MCREVLKTITSHLQIMLSYSEGRYDDCPSIGEEEPCLSQGVFQQASVLRGLN